jgi:hypothetical protein
VILRYSAGGKLSDAATAGTESVPRNAAAKMETIAPLPPRSPAVAAICPADRPFCIRRHASRQSAVFADDRAASSQPLRWSALLSRNTLHM